MFWFHRQIVLNFGFPFLDCSLSLRLLSLSLSPPPLPFSLSLSLSFSLHPPFLSLSLTLSLSLVLSCSLSLSLSLPPSLPPSLSLSLCLPRSLSLSASLSLSLSLSLLPSLLFPSPSVTLSFSLLFFPKRFSFQLFHLPLCCFFSKTPSIVNTTGIISKGPQIEGVAVFHRNDKYYLIGSHLTGKKTIVAPVQDDPASSSETLFLNF